MKFLSYLGICCLVIVGVLGSCGCRSSRKPASQQPSTARASKALKSQPKARKVVKNTAAGKQAKTLKKTVVKKTPPLRLVKVRPPVLRRTTPKLPTLQVVPWHQLPPNLRKGYRHAPILRPAYRAPMAKSARFGGVVDGKKKPRVPKAVKGEAICRVYLHITGMT